MEINYEFMADLASEFKYQWMVEKLYGKLIADKLDQEFDVYVGYDESNGYFSCDAIGLKIAMRDVKDYNDLFDMIKSKLDGGESDAKLKNKFDWLFKELGVESKVGEFHDYSRGSFNTMGFFDLLWYLKTDEFIRDGSIGHDLMDTAQAYADKYPNDEATYFYPQDFLRYQIRQGEWIDMTTVDPKFSGWQIKFFKNGKIQMKGMKDSDWEKIVHIDNIVIPR